MVGYDQLTSHTALSAHAWLLQVIKQCETNCE